MPIAEVERLASYLAWEWDLSELEYREVLSWGKAMAMCENNWQDTSAHMEMRAELMALAGSDYDRTAPHEPAYVDPLPDDILADHLNEEYTADKPWYEEGAGQC